MSKKISITELPSIENPNYLYIFKNIISGTTSVTRNNYGIINCRISLIIYILITIVFNKLKVIPNQIDIEQFTPYMQKIFNYYQQIIQQQNKLYTFLIMNNPKLINYIDKHTTNINKILQQGNIENNHIFPMALVNDNYNVKPFEKGVIEHYFAILYKKHTRKYSILSSYGSIFVQIPQQEKEITIEQITNLIETLTSSTSDIEKQKIINQYFLSNGKKKYSKMETISKPIMVSHEPKDGAKKELKHYSGKKIKIVYFHTLINDIQLNFNTILNKTTKLSKTTKSSKINKSSKTTKLSKTTKSSKINKSSKITKSSKSTKKLHH